MNDINRNVKRRSVFLDTKPELSTSEKTYTNYGYGGNKMSNGIPSIRQYAFERDFSTDVRVVFIIYYYIILNNKIINTRQFTKLQN